MSSISDVSFKPVEVRSRTGRAFAVRAYSPGDFEVLVGMYKSFEPKRVAQGLPPPDVPRIARWLDHLQNNSHALLAFDGEKAIVQAILCPISKNHVEYTIFVLQDYRGEGLGTVLSKLALDWAFAMGFTTAFLATETSNFAAIGLFRKLGFLNKSSDGDECEMKLDLLADSKARAA
jgi:ribosomal protein S18 acetylase RimI-like enzyme